MTRAYSCTQLSKEIFKAGYKTCSFYMHRDTKCAELHTDRMPHHPGLGSSPKKGDECTPKKNVMFLKTHKCAGSSVYNVLMRRSQEQKLLVALPKTSSHLLGYPRHFNPEHHLLNYSRCGHKPNILTMHMRFNETVVEEVWSSASRLLHLSFYLYALVSYPRYTGKSHGLVYMLSLAAISFTILFLNFI